MRARPKPGGVYYYYDSGGKPRKEIALGKDYVEAVRRWAELESETKSSLGILITFKDVADRYTRDIIPTKAPRTQKDNLKELASLLKFFNNPPAPLNAIKPINIRQFMDWRGKEAKTRANREKALFSHIWNKAREWGLTDQPNPCAGIEGFTEEGRDIYVSDDVLEALLKVADEPLKEAVDLAYLTGQRPSDVLKMKMTDIKDGCLEIAQRKTKVKLRLQISGDLANLITQ